MKLAGTAVNSDQIDLYLTINFNEPCKPIAGGSVAFGFKRGELTWGVPSYSVLTLLTLT